MRIFTPEGGGEAASAVSVPGRADESGRAPPNKEQPPFCNAGPGAAAAAALSGTGRGGGGCREEPVLGLFPARCEARRGGKCHGGGVAAARLPVAALVSHGALRSSSGVSPRALPAALGGRWRCTPHPPHPVRARIALILIPIREQWSLPRAAPSADPPALSRKRGTGPPLTNLISKSKRNSTK